MAYIETLSGNRDSEADRFRPGDWDGLRSFCDNFPQKPTQRELERLLAIALRKEFWVVRGAAVSVLARMEFPPQILLDIAREDERLSVRGEILEWVTDYKGQRFKYELKTSEKYQGNPFGRDWKVEGLTSANAVIAAVDSDGNNDRVKMIGLSILQIRNFDLSRNSPALPLEDLSRITKRRKKGLLDGHDFGKLAIIYEGRSVDALVYDAIDSRAIPGCGVRVSLPVAQVLGLQVGSEVWLAKKTT